jgi:hypothetical protein
MGGNPPMGFEEWEGMSQMIYAGCPDGKHTFDETLEIGDRVAYRGSFCSLSGSCSCWRRTLGPPCGSSG